VLDEHLLVRAAEGESILRLPWFDEALFVGRQLPDVTEIPARIRSLAVDNYRAALGGAYRSYAFTSYGHRYGVDAIPMRGEDGRVECVLAVATPAADHRSPRARDVAAESAPPQLTPREVEVLTLASHGQSYVQIAEQLVLTPGTVKTHLAHCYAKLEAPDKAAAVATALRLGLIT
jgi:DNA-binding CsgD family transcriptional regulator